MFTSFFNWISDAAQSGIDNTFGQMTGMQVLWTIMGLVVIYQLFAIKWTLIDRNRSNQTPHSFMAPQRRWINRGVSRWQDRRDPTPDPIIDTMKTGTPYVPDSARNSTFEQFVPADETQLVDSKPGASTHRSSSQAGLASFVPMSFGRRDLNSWTDFEIANQLSGERLNRLNDLRGHLSLGD